MPTTHTRHAETTVPPPLPVPADPFDVVKAARAVVGGIERGEASAQTVAGYKVLARKLLDAPDPVAAAADTSSSGTWCRRRSALRYVARDALQALLAQQDQLQRGLRGVPGDDPRWRPWYEQVHRLHHWTALVDRLAEVQIATKPRQTKRAGLGGLPETWREDLVARMPLWRREVLTLAATGCRPAELAAGVVFRIEGEHLLASVKGVKVKQHAGQPERVLLWKLPVQAPVLQQLADEVRQAGGSLRVSYDGRQNTKPARALSDAIESAAKRAFGPRKHSITAYTLRHAAASDLKAAGLPEEQVSAALGHAVTETAAQYGGRPMGRKGSGSVAPAAAKGARQVKVSKPSPTAWNGPGLKAKAASGVAKPPARPRPR